LFRKERPLLLRRKDRQFYASNPTNRSGSQQFGPQKARQIAKLISATIPVGSSNECVLDGETIVIHCAKLKTKNVGVTYNMLDRVAKVLGAFEEGDGRFRVLVLDRETFCNNMRPTASTGASAGKVGIVEKVAFERDGKLIDILSLPE
jgi:hypothetical protein